MSPKTFTFRSGGWLLLLGVLLALLVFVLRVIPLLTSRDSSAVGDGMNVESYGFDLSTCLVPRDEIVAGGFAKGALPVLTHPPLLTVAQLDSINEVERGKYLVSDDRVIGVWIGKQARAYPLSVLNWHEIVNDTIAGKPIAVTYNPLCDAAVVFYRVLNTDTLRFGVSGLLYNSNLIMYDARPGGKGESLWSQLKRSAIAGPTADKGFTLSLVPFALVQWADWRERFPETLILDRDPDRIKLYKKKPYARYFGSEILRFPVNPLPPDDILPLKSEMVMVGAGDRWAAFPLSHIGKMADGRGEWKTVWDGIPLSFHYTPDPPTASVRADILGKPVYNLYAFWFAWHAMEPETELITP